MKIRYNKTIKKHKIKKKKKQIVFIIYILILFGIISLTTGVLYFIFYKR